MFKDDVLERSEPALQEVESSHLAPAPPHRRSKQEIARAPLLPDSTVEQPELPSKPVGKRLEASKGRRSGLLHRRPVL